MVGWVVEREPIPALRECGAMERNSTKSLIMLGFAVPQPNLHFLNQLHKILIQPTQVSFVCVDAVSNALFSPDRRGINMT